MSDKELIERARKAAEAARTQHQTKEAMERAQKAAREADARFRGKK